MQNPVAMPQTFDAGETCLPPDEAAVTTSYCREPTTTDPSCLNASTIRLSTPRQSVGDLESEAPVPWGTAIFQALLDY
jgi:hypothetical protein